MSEFTKNDKFLYSIMDVCNAIHGSYCGTGDGLSDEELQKYVAWLKWRLTDGWDNYNFKQYTAYDTAVRNLAFASLAEGEKHFQEINK